MLTPMVPPLPPALQKLLDEGVLVDPQSLVPLRLSDDALWLQAPGGPRYPVADGVPRLIRLAAEPGPSPSLPDPV